MSPLKLAIILNFNISKVVYYDDLNDFKIPDNSRFSSRLSSSLFQCLIFCLTSEKKIFVFSVLPELQNNFLSEKDKCGVGPASSLGVLS